MKYLIALAILIAAYFGYSQLQDTQNKTDSVVSESLEIIEKTNNYTIDVQVQSTGFEKIDTAIALENVIELIQFKELASSSQTASSAAQYELTKTSEKFSSSDVLQLGTLVISQYEYTGGAHGNVSYDTYTYGKEKGLQYDITNIVSMSPELTDLIVKKTIKIIKKADSEVDTATVRQAVGDINNLQNFYLTDNKLVFLFAPYVVGPYALGSQAVEIDMQELLPYTRGAIQKAYGYTDPAQATTTPATKQ